MFNTKEKKPFYGEKAAQNSATLISAGTVLKGNIECAGDLRIDGQVQGDISCEAKVIVGPEGSICGNIFSGHADVCGTVNGDIVVKESLQLSAGCRVQGNIAASSLQIDPQALFNGACQMTTVAQVVSINEKELPLAEAK